MTLGRRAPVLVVALLMWSGVAVDRVLFAQQPQPAPTAMLFYCPMHGEITSTTEGICSRCGMKLVPGDPYDAREYLVDMKPTPQAVRPGRPARLTFTIRHPESRATVRSFATVHD